MVVLVVILGFAILLNILWIAELVTSIFGDDVVSWTLVVLMDVRSNESGIASSSLQSPVALSSSHCGEDLFSARRAHIRSPNQSSLFAPARRIIATIEIQISALG